MEDRWGPVKVYCLETMMECDWGFLREKAMDGCLVIHSEERMVQLMVVLKVLLMALGMAG